MLYLKSCPRCKGDIQANSDHVGAFLKCLQCSYTVNESVPRYDSQGNQTDTSSVTPTQSVR